MEFEQIYSTYFKALCLYAMQHCDNKHIAHDITSETFLKVIRAVERNILHGISEPYKEVLPWRVFEELSFNEIGNL